MEKDLFQIKMGGLINPPIFEIDKVTGGWVG
jgi:hypothetical protein